MPSNDWEIFAWAHFSRAFLSDCNTGMAFGMGGLNDRRWRDGQKGRIPLGALGTFTGSRLRYVDVGFDAIDGGEGAL